MPHVNFHMFLLAFAYFGSADIIEKTTENYGPYTLEMEQIYTCRGPKVTNLTTLVVNLVSDPNDFKAAINATFLERAKIEDVKMSVYTLKEDRKILLYNYKINEPCQHYALSKVFETYVKSKNCVVEKGSYNCSFNLSEIMKTYLGPSFFYGQFVFKVIVTCKKGNITCLVFYPNFRKI